MIAVLLATGSAAAMPERDLNLQDASLLAAHGEIKRGDPKLDGSIDQGDVKFPVDVKSTNSEDVRLYITSSTICRSGEPMLAYELYGPLESGQSKTQKIMHKLHDRREDAGRWGERLRTSFELFVPESAAFEAPTAGTRVLIYQIWQGAPFQPPLALSIVDADEHTFDLLLDVNVIDHPKRRKKLTRLTLPRQTCLKVEIDARPTDEAMSPGNVSFRVETTESDSTPKTLFQNEWTVRFGIEHDNPRNFHPNRCTRRPKTPCCRKLRANGKKRCLPNQVFQSLFGLYRRTQPTFMRILISDVRHEHR